VTALGRRVKKSVFAKSNARRPSTSLQRRRSMDLYLAMADHHGRSLTTRYARPHLLLLTPVFFLALSLFFSIQSLMHADRRAR